MIKYILKCKNKHEFESWFLNSFEFEKLKEKKLIKCIFCKSQNMGHLIFIDLGKTGAENDEDPFNQILTILDMGSISIKKHEMKVW